MIRISNYDVQKGSIYLPLFKDAQYKVLLILIFEVRTCLATEMYRANRQLHI